jgi:hypothetical protein
LKNVATFYRKLEMNSKIQFELTTYLEKFKGKGRKKPFKNRGN